MDVRKIVLLVGVLLVAAVTAVMAKNRFSGAGAPTASATPGVPVGPEILVATRALPVGTIIDAEALRYQPWPEGLVQNAYYAKGQEGSVNPADLLGTVVRNEITAGQPVTQGSLIKPGERGFLAAALGPGMRAVTVSVSTTSGVAGFVFPGDRVDLVLTQEVTGDGDSLKVSETVLRNVRVLAADQRMNRVDEEGKPVVQSASTVTLEVTPKIAEKIAVAQTIGQLSLSLRSLADNTAELERAIASGDIDVPDDADPDAERQMMMEIASRPMDKNTTFTVGADVSRFERSSVPAQQSNAPAGSAPSDPAAAIPTGPVVRVARGNAVTVIPVGAK